MSELKPCPFCGGQAEILTDSHVIAVKTSVGCQDDECRGFIGLSWLYDTEAEAIAAWNSRAERTCECVADYAESPFDGKTIVLHRCSACHELMRPHMRYCPNCGAKVIERKD